MTHATDGGWFCYSPLSSTGWDRLSAEQREMVVCHREEHAERAPVGEVAIVLHSLQPGQAELRFGTASNGATTADLIDAAIRELQSARTMFAD